MSCGRCGGDRLWRVQMHERGRHGAIVPMAVAYAPRAPVAPPPIDPKSWPRPLKWFNAVPYGQLETIICESCGFTVWYAHSFRPDEWINLAEDEDDRAPCVDCLGTQCWYIPTVMEQGGSGDVGPLRAGLGEPRLYGGAKFSVRVCKGCGRLRWWVHPVDTADRHPAETCSDCGDRQRWHIASVFDSAGIFGGELRIQVAGGGAHALWASSVGKLSAQACTGCHRVDWFARELKISAVDPGVELLQGQTRTAGGPYR